MGNKQSVKQNEDDEKLTENGFIWAASNSKLTKVCGVPGKIYGADVRSIEGDNTVTIALCDQSGYVTLARGDISRSQGKNNKVVARYKQTARISLKSAWCMSVSLSRAGEYIASGGLDNTVTIHRRNESGNYVLHRELMTHQGYVASLRFVDSGVDGPTLLLSSSGDASVCLWDVEQNEPLLQISDACSSDIMAVDHIYIDNMHIIAFCDLAKRVYVRQIDDKYMKPKQNSPQMADSDEKSENKNPKGILFVQQTLGQFANDVNDVRFSPNGQFLAATSDDGTYEIYAKNYKFDSFWNIDVLEWTFLCSRSFHSPGGKTTGGSCLHWADDETLFCAEDSTSLLYCTFIRARKANPAMLKAITDGVQIAIESLQHMAWLGLVPTLANEIIQFFNEYDIFDYQYKVYSEDSRISCLASCQFGPDRKDRILVFGGWNKECKAIIPQ